MRLARMAGILIVIIAARIPAAWCQVEIDPDRYDAPNMIPVQKPDAKPPAEAATVRYLGSFRLPYALQCHGAKLRPGQYSLTLRSEGVTGHATLTQHGQAIALRGVLRQPTQTEGVDVILVEHDGASRRLVEIQAAKMVLVFDSDMPVSVASHSKVKRIDRLPLLVTATRTTAR